MDPDPFDADDVPPDLVEVGGFEDLDDWYDDDTVSASALKDPFAP